MKKKLAALALSGLLTFSFCLTAFAGQWRENEFGWWWQNDDGSYPVNSWQWLDGNRDGIAECYYFDSMGYMLENTVTPDGYTVNADGAWIENGAVQTKAAELPAVSQPVPNTGGIYGTYLASNGDRIEIFDQNGALYLKFTWIRDGGEEFLLTQMEKINDAFYESTVYDWSIQILSSTQIVALSEGNEIFVKQ